MHKIAILLKCNLQRLHIMQQLSCNQYVVCCWFGEKLYPKTHH